jgi:hypothetical protein
MSIVGKVIIGREGRGMMKNEKKLMIKKRAISVLPHKSKNLNNRMKEDGQLRR